MTGDCGHAELHGGQALFTYTYSDVDAFLNVISGVAVATVHRWKLQTLMLSGKKGGGYSQSSGSFETRDDSVKDSQTLVQDKRQLHAALLQHSRYARRSLKATDLSNEMAAENHAH